MTKQRNRRSSQGSHAHGTRSRIVAVEAALRTHDFVDLEPKERVRLEISQLPGAFYAFRSRRKKSPSGE